MGKNAGLHQAPTAINAVGSSLAKIFAQQPAYYQKGQQLALMQKLQEQQIASGATTQQINQNKIDASNAIAAAINKFGGEQKIYIQDEGGNFILRPEVGQAMAAAALSADPNFDISKIQEAMSPAKPLDPVDVDAGHQKLFDPTDRRNPNHKPSGISAAAIRGVEPPMPEPDMTDAGANSANGNDPNGFTAPAPPTGLSAAATAGVNPNVYSGPKAQKNMSPELAKAIADDETVIGRAKSAAEATGANPHAFGLSNVFGRYRQYLPFATPEDSKTAASVGAVTVPFQHKMQGGQVTASEDARGSGLIPAMTDKAQNAGNKLSGLIDLATQDRDNLVRTAGIDYTPPYPGSTPIPLTPSGTSPQVPAANPSPTPFQVKTPEDFHALAPGAQFTTPDGRILIKQ